MPSTSSSTSSTPDLPPHRRTSRTDPPPPSSSSVRHAPCERPSSSSRLRVSQLRMASGYAPPVVITSSDGRRWRQCAGAAIINSRGELLVGERLKIANAWNCPQGGVDAGESLVGAASREADEEVGLVVGTHIAPIATMGPAGGVQYEAKGWLRKEGFAGQQIHWTLFRTISAVGDREVGDVADLQGRNGEAAEFKQVRWMPIEQVVDSMWEASPRKTHTHTCCPFGTCPVLPCSPPPQAQPLPCSPPSQASPECVSSISTGEASAV